MTAVAVCAALLGALLAAAPAAAPSEPPAPGAAVVESPDGWRADLALDGSLLGWAAPKDAAGRRAVFVLVGPPSSPSSAVAPCGVEEAGSERAARDARLFRWRPEDPRVLTPMASGWPRGGLDAADLDGDGAEELLLRGDGAIDRAVEGPPGRAMMSLAPFVRDADLGFALGDPRSVRSTAEAFDSKARAAVPGAFRTYLQSVTGGGRLASSVDLPARVIPGRTRVSLQTSGVAAIGRGRSGRMLFATVPEAVGNQRLRTFLLDPDGPPETARVECWMQLPTPERLLDSGFFLVDGAPVLVVTTMSAEKLSVFGEKRLRVFDLGTDRTRVGAPPAFAAVTGLNIWQEARPAVTDLDRDGRDDLVIAYWKGLKSTIAALEVYRGVPEGGFSKPRTMEFDVKDADVGFLSFGADADGDGLPDLLVIAEGQVAVYPGPQNWKPGAKPVSDRPSRRVPLPPGTPEADSVSVAFGSEGVVVSRPAPGFGTPRLVDLDGDRRTELVLAGDVAGTGRLAVIVFRGPASRESP